MSFNLIYQLMNHSMIRFLKLTIYYAFKYILDKDKLKKINERKMCNEDPDHSRKSIESNPNYEKKTLLAK